VFPLSILSPNPFEQETIRSNKNKKNVLFIATNLVRRFGVAEDLQKKEG
jgi:hypothetical protein